MSSFKYLFVGTGLHWAVLCK